MFLSSVKYCDHTTRQLEDIKENPVHIGKKPVRAFFPLYHCSEYHLVCCQFKRRGTLFSFDNHDYQWGKEYPLSFYINQCKINFMIMQTKIRVSPVRIHFEKLFSSLFSSKNLCTKKTTTWCGRTFWKLWFAIYLICFSLKKTPSNLHRLMVYIISCHDRYFTKFWFRNLIDDISLSVTFLKETKICALCYHFACHLAASQKTTL